MTNSALLAVMHRLFSALDESIAPQDKLAFAHSVMALSKFDPNKKLSPAGSKRRGKIDQHFEIFSRVLGPIAAKYREGGFDHEGRPVGGYRSMDPELLDPAHMVRLAQSYIRLHGNPITGRGRSARVALGHNDVDAHIAGLAKHKGKQLTIDAARHQALPTLGARSLDQPRNIGAAPSRSDKGDLGSQIASPASDLPRDVERNRLSTMPPEAREPSDIDSVVAGVLRHSALGRKQKPLAQAALGDVAHDTHYDPDAQRSPRGRARPNAQRVSELLPRQPLSREAAIAKGAGLHHPEVEKFLKQQLGLARR
jgi:hypothetical protein